VDLGGLGEAGRAWGFPWCKAFKFKGRVPHTLTHPPRHTDVIISVPGNLIDMLGTHAAPLATGMIAYLFRYDESPSKSEYDIGEVNRRWRS
jgi:hypothetical protein